jgi:hypothetical protein
VSANPLYKESGGDDASRSSEAIKLLEMIDDNALVSPSDSKFVSDCRERLEQYGQAKFWISAKQLFWLRDIKDRQL